MTRVLVSRAFICLTLIAAAVGVFGCREDAGSGGSSSVVDNRPAQPTPEERFEQIAETFRRAVDTNVIGEQTGFMVREGGGHSRFTVSNKVSHKLIPPSEASEPYRGTITVVSHYSYSLRIPAEETDPQTPPANQDAPADASGLPLDNGVEVLDDNLIAAAKKSDDPDSAASEDKIARRSDEDERTYELVYQNDRWVLKTPLDPKTEQSIQYAFDHALAIQ